MLKPAQVRSVGLHATSAVAGGVAVLMWAASHSVDLYAVVDQLNKVVAAVATLVATVTPLATAAYAAYKAGTKQKLLDAVAAPDAAQAAREIPPTPQVVAVAEQLKKNGS